MAYICIGTIRGTHGIKGEVKVRSNSDFKLERFKKGNILYLDFKGKMIDIEINSYRPHKEFDLITFNNLTNINDVLDYLNCDIYIKKEELPQLAEDEYYFHELIGLLANSISGESIGEVIDVEESPQGAMLIIKKLDGKNAIIPFVKEFVKEVNIERGRLIVTPIEGLL